jgi:hypothetical protein
MLYSINNIIFYVIQYSGVDPETLMKGEGLRYGVIFSIIDGTSASAD